MKMFLFTLALLVVGCATDAQIPVGFVITEVSAETPPAPPKDGPNFPNVKVEVNSNAGAGASTKVVARSRGESCGGARCKVRAVVSKVRIRR